MPPSLHSSWAYTHARYTGPTIEQNLLIVELRGFRDLQKWNDSPRFLQIYWQDMESIIAACLFFGASKRLDYLLVLEEHIEYFIAIF